jgi:hypothetical protein
MATGKHSVHTNIGRYNSGPWLTHHPQHLMRGLFMDIDDLGASWSLSNQIKQ